MPRTESMQRPSTEGTHGRSSRHAALQRETRHIGTATFSSSLVPCMAAVLGDSPEALRAEIARLQAALLTNQVAAVHAQRAQARAQKQAGKAGLGALGCKAIVCVYVLTDCNVELALRMARQWTRLKDPEENGYPTELFVENLFLKASDVDLQQIFSPHGTPWAAAVASANAFLAEAATVSWIQDCNAMGVAPLSLDVYGKWEKSRFGGLREGLPKRRQVNQWVHRFRSKWALRRARLHPQVHRDPGTIRDKVGEAVLFFSPFSGPKKGSGQLKLISQGRPDKVPFLGSLLLPLAGPRVLAAGCVLHYQQI